MLRTFRITADNQTVNRECAISSERVSDDAVNRGRGEPKGKIIVAYSRSREND